MVASTYVEATKSFTPFTEEQRSEYQRQLIDSFNKMKNVVGDMRNEVGNAVLTPALRPPTLANSRLALWTLFDVGYKWSISGDLSTSDYNLDDPNELSDMLENGKYISYLNSYRKIGPGSVVVMHMSSTASHTAEALDKFFTDNEAKPADKRWNFVRPSDYLVMN
jgi:hypothetical protein